MANDLPKMEDNIDTFLDRKISQMESTEQKRARNERVSNYTLQDFVKSKRSRLWAFKQSGHLVDSAFVTEDGNQEVGVKTLVLVLVLTLILPLNVGDSCRCCYAFRKRYDSILPFGKG